MLGYMPQKTGLYEELTVFENFSLFGRLRGLAADELKAKFEELMTLSGLAGFEDRQAGQLSGGMKQKLGLSCALLGDPKLLILDEPTVGVDPLSRKELRRILDAMRTKTGMTVVMSSAYLDEAEEADLALIIDHGRIAAVGRPSELSSRLSGRTFRAEPERPEDAPELARALMEEADPAGRSSACRKQFELLDAVPRGRFVDLLSTGSPA